MRADRLEITIPGLPDHREAQLPGNFSARRQRVPVQMEELLSGAQSELIQWICSSETEGEFEQRISELRSLERPIKIRQGSDVLGIYSSQERAIYLDPEKIRPCADQISSRRSTILYGDLYRLVTIHEEAHALHHLAVDRRAGSRIWEDFETITSCLKEILAQRFTYKACQYHSSLLKAFEALETAQPLVYRL
ncbi:MAG: hypothetical protein FJY85_09665 [Deltaproteobacteria bacterium]|nr:hypothetical protein [Deltaproteobacteria bacterium]